MSLQYPICGSCDRIEDVFVRWEWCLGGRRVVARYQCSALAIRPVLVRDSSVGRLKKNLTFGNAINGARL